MVCVSRLMPRKGQGTLIEALPQIRQRVPEAALLLVGGGPHRSHLERLARKAAVSEDVVFAGSVPFEEVHDVTEMVEHASRAAVSHGFAGPGDVLVVIGGLPFGTSGSTNLLHVARIPG